jgi:predicted aconitase with swiveling domain
VEKKLIGKPIVSGSAEGIAVVSEQPISFWGGVSPYTGEIIDRRHDRSGCVISGRVFVFPQGKGSSSASAVLMESVRAGTAPAAIINLETEPILALGAIVAHELYHEIVPIVVLTEEDFYTIQEGDRLIIQPDGAVTIKRGDQPATSFPGRNG